MYAYIGSRTTRERNARGDGISIFRVGDDASLTLVDVVGNLVNPSYLALNPARDCLYAVHGDCSDISAFRVDAATGRLTLLNRQHTGGRNPVHLALSPDGRHVVVSNHVTSNLAVLPLREDGSLGEYCQLLQLDGPLGPHRIEQQMSKPHFNPFDRSDKYVLVPDKGLDRTFSFRFEQGRLVPASQQFAVSREGAGPRHLAFHPLLDMAYVVNELDSTITACRWQDGELTPLQILSMLPSHYTGNSRAAAVQVDAMGRYLYASNRGHDSIAVFAIAADSGLLEFVCAESCRGRTPRFFTLSPSGRHMYVLNEDSDSIVVMEVVASSGRLRPAGLQVACGSPVCMVFSG